MIDKSSALLTEKKTPVSRIEVKEAVSTTDHTKQKGVIKEYYERLYTNKLDYCSEMETF